MALQRAALFWTMYFSVMKLLQLVSWFVTLTVAGTLSVFGILIRLVSVLVLAVVVCVFVTSLLVIVWQHGVMMTSSCIGVLNCGAGRAARLASVVTVD